MITGEAGNDTHERRRRQRQVHSHHRVGTATTPMSAPAAPATRTTCILTTAPAATVNLALGTACSPAPGTTAPATVENVIGTSSRRHPDRQRGANTLDGRGGNDTINAGGGSGSSTVATARTRSTGRPAPTAITGGLGNRDVMTAANGNDISSTSSGDGNDTYTGGAGTRRIPTIYPVLRPGQPPNQLAGTASSRQTVATPWPPSKTFAAPGRRRSDRRGRRQPARRPGWQRHYTAAPAPTGSPAARVTTP